MSRNRGTCLHALTIPRPWQAWGITRGIVFQDAGGPGIGGAGDLGAGCSLLRMTNLQQAGAYELDSSMVVLPHPYRPGDETEALGMVRAPLETQTRLLAIDRVLRRGRAADAVIAASVEDFLATDPHHVLGTPAAAHIHGRGACGGGQNTSS